MASRKARLTSNKRREAKQLGNPAKGQTMNRVEKRKGRPSKQRQTLHNRRQQITEHGETMDEVHEMQKSIPQTNSLLSRSIGPRNAEFRLILEADGVVYPGEVEPYPENYSELREAMERRRPSVYKTEQELSAIRSRIMAVPNEDGIGLLEDILGDSQCLQTIHDQRFTFLEPFNRVLTQAQPDHMGGLERRSLHEVILTTIGRLIIPSNKSQCPCAPNFFIEKKGPSGTPFHALNQAVYYGVLGARAFHALKSCLPRIPSLGRASTISITYENSGSHVSIYCVHIIQSLTDSLGYKITYLESFDLRKDWLRAATAIRNLRDYAADELEELLQSLHRLEENELIKLAEHVEPVLTKLRGKDDIFKTTEQTPTQQSPD